MKKKCLTVLVVLTLLLGALFAFAGCNKQETTIKIVPVELTGEQYGYCVNDEDGQLLENVNAFLEKIIADGTLDGIYAKYDSTQNHEYASITGIGAVETDESGVENPLIVATNTDFEPFEYKNGENFCGIDMEVALLLAEYLGKTLVVKDMDFDAVVTSVEQGLCHIGMAGLTISNDRIEAVQFSIPYYGTTQMIVVCDDDTTFDGCTTKEDVEEILASLEGVKAGAQISTTGFYYVNGSEDFGFDGFENITVNSYDSASLAVTDMVNGAINFVVVDKAPAIAMVEKINSQNEKGAKWDLFVRSFKEYEGGKTILEGLKNTLLIAVIGLVIGIVIGTVIAVIKVMPRENKVARFFGYIGDLYVTVFRGTPLVVQLLIFYYILFPAMGLRIDNLVVAIVTFGMNSGAYVAEIMRGGIQSIDKGQFEAGRALGLGYGTTMAKIVIPQAMKNVLPTLGNEFIALIKDTSVVGFIATLDLTQAFKRIGSQNYEFVVPYLLLALIYLVLVLVVTAIVKLIERRMNRSDRRN